MEKNDKRVLTVSAIVFVAFTAIAFAIPFVKAGAFWPGYIFGVIAIAAQYPLYMIAFRKGSDVRSKFYGFPIIRLGLVYLVIQLILSVIFMATAAVAPAWIAILLSILLACAIGVGYIAASATRDEVERQDTILKKNVDLMRGLQSKTANMVTLTEDPELRKALSVFADKVKYSDPVSNDRIAEAESNLYAAVNELENAVIDGDKDNAIVLCRRADALLSERNRLCRLNK